MRIENVLFAPSFGGFFNDDQAAIKGGAKRDGFLYSGSGITPGFAAIRVPAAALGIGLALTDGTVVWGDVMTVQYSGVAGREARFDPAALGQELKETIAPNIVGQAVTAFRPLVNKMIGQVGSQPALTASVRYGVTQALLAAVAYERQQTAAEVVCAEYGFPLVARPVPIYCQSGEDRRLNVDKMILRRADLLPHGLINNPNLIGEMGEAFLDYAVWVRDRVLRHGGDAYRPILHFDVYGGIGDAFGNDTNKIADYLCRLGERLQPLVFQIEAVADFGSRKCQVKGFASIRRKLRDRSCAVKLVADEWCNTLHDIYAFNDAGAADVIQLKMPDIGSLDETVRAIQACRAAGTGIYLGGSCTETDLSARMSVQIAVATQVDMQLAKPGMGVDEGYMITANEQARLLAVLESRVERSGASTHRPAANCKPAMVVPGESA